jgi:hypothetical protein
VSNMDEQRTLDIAREALIDIKQLEHCSYRLGRLQGPQGLPALIVVFDYPEAAVVPALAIGLASLATGTLYTEEKVKRAVRNGVEQYLHKCGVPKPPEPKENPFTSALADAYRVK